MGDSCVGQNYNGTFYSPVKTNVYHPGDQIEIKFYGGSNNGSDLWRTYQLFFQSQQYQDEHDGGGSSSDKGITILIDQVNYTYPSAQWNKSDNCNDTTIDYGNWTIPTVLSPQQDEQFVIVWKDITNSTNTNATTATSNAFQVLAATTATTTTSTTSSTPSTTTPVTTTPSNSTDTTANATSSGMSNGTKAGVGVGAALVFVILMAILFLFWGRRGNKLDYASGYDNHLMTTSRVFDKSQLDLAALDQYGGNNSHHHNNTHRWAMSGANGYAQRRASLQSPQRAAYSAASHRSLMMGISPLGSLSELSRSKDVGGVGVGVVSGGSATSRKSATADIVESARPSKELEKSGRSPRPSVSASRSSRRSFLDAEGKEMMLRPGSQGGLGELPPVSPLWSESSAPKF